MIVRTIVALMGALLIAACSSGGGGGSSAGSGTSGGSDVSAAIAKDLDKRGHGVENRVNVGMDCGDVRIAAYKKTGHAMIRNAPRQRGQTCFTVTWDKTMTSVARKDGFQLVFPLGHYVVDKLGEPQDAGGGIKTTPFRAHFELSPLGKSFVDAGPIYKPKDIPSGQAVMTKDVDGNFVADVV